MQSRQPIPAVLHPSAAQATREFLKPRYAIPIHYGTNPQLKGTPAEYRQALGETPTQVLSLNPGESARF